jgi:hypothetical protein
MSMGLLLRIHSPPLDVEALLDFIDRLPGVQVREDGARLAGPSVLIQVQPESVLIAFRWQDNRFGHGAAIGERVLARHRCTGQDIDYGGLLADNEACRRHLAATGRVTPSSPERVQAVLSPILIGAELTGIEVSRAELIARFTRSEQPVGALRLSRVTTRITPPPAATGSLEEDERLLLWLSDALELYAPVLSLEVGWGSALTLRWAEQTCTILAAPDAPDGEPIWTVEDGQGVLVEAFAGGGPMLHRA